MSDTVKAMDEREISALSEISDTNVLVGRVLDRYPVNCTSLCRLEYTRLDSLCDRLTRGEGDRAECIREIISIVKRAQTGNPEPCPIVKKIKAEISSDLANEITASELAETVGISLYYMLHIFRKETGKTITEYRNECRLKTAAKLLSGGNCNMTEIAEKCGYSDSSYFSKCFRQYYSVTPLEYRKIIKETVKMNAVLKNANDKDLILYNMLEGKSILADTLELDKLTGSDAVETYIVTSPTEEYGFLHEAAITEFEGVLYAAWYNCPKRELADSSPIRFAKSFDGGKTWTDPKKVVDDPSGEILYCPPVFGIQDGRLYMFINQMSKPDHIHSLDLYAYSSEIDNFTPLWSRGDIPVKLNTNVYTLSNGKLLLPGRWCVRDTFANTPCVLISDSGRIDADWRIVKIQESPLLPDGSTLIHPEMSAIIDGSRVFIFCRMDERNLPILYVSEDNGESWSAPISHDIPFSDSKIYSDNLSDGRSYVIGNLYPGRSKLVILFSERCDIMKFTKGVVLRDAKNDVLDICSYWCYPVAFESDGKLYVIYSYDVGNLRRGAALSVIDLKKI